ncbi:MAG TPA: hypothetical protein PKA74_11630, partial [Bauldia sp.]|nr:hypothetical protein [Bauldia sp.]
QLVATNFETLTGGTHGRVSIPRPLAGVIPACVQANLLFLAMTLAIVAVLMTVRWARRDALGLTAPEHAREPVAAH